MNKDELTGIMRRAVGFVLFTFSLLAVPKALGALVTIGIISYNGLPRDTEAGKIIKTLMTTQLSVACTNIAQFVILLLLARWVFRGPKVLRTWMQAEPSDGANAALGAPRSSS